MQTDWADSRVPRLVVPRTAPPPENTLRFAPKSHIFAVTQSIPIHPTPNQQHRIGLAKQRTNPVESVTHKKVGVGSLKKTIHATTSAVFLGVSSVLSQNKPPSWQLCQKPIWFDGSGTISLGCGPRRSCADSDIYFWCSSQMQLRRLCWMHFIWKILHSGWDKLPWRHPSLFAPMRVHQWETHRKVLYGQIDDRKWYEMTKSRVIGGEG